MLTRLLSWAVLLAGLLSALFAGMLGELGLAAIEVSTLVVLLAWVREEQREGATP